MGRIRTIKPEFPQSETIGRLSREARLLFIQLWTFVDDSGRARAASRMLASHLYPYDEDAPSLIDGWMAELAAEGIVQLYEVGGNHYLQITNWLKHQRIDRPTPSKHPSFDECSTNPRRDLDDASKPDHGPWTIGHGPWNGNEDPRIRLNSDNNTAQITITKSWMPAEETRMWCALKCVTGKALDAEVEHFRSYYLSRGETRSDWDEQFKTWIINRAKFRGDQPAESVARPKFGSPGFA